MWNLPDVYNLVLELPEFFYGTILFLLEWIEV